MGRDNMDGFDGNTPTSPDTSAEDAVLGAVLRRFLTEDEPGYDDPPYADLREADSELCLDGSVTVTEAERVILARILRA